MLKLTLRRLETVLDGASLTLEQHLTTDALNAAAMYDTLQREIGVLRERKNSGDALSVSESEALHRKGDESWELYLNIRKLCFMEFVRRLLPNLEYSTYDTISKVRDALDEADLSRGMLAHQKKSESVVLANKLAGHLAEIEKNMNKLGNRVRTGEVELYRAAFEKDVKSLDVPTMIEKMWPTKHG